MILSPEDVKEFDLQALCSEASRLRDQGKGHTISFSPKVFLPLTRLCRDICGYCTYRQSASQASELYLSPEEVLRVARSGEALGCREALLVLGERPEERYPQARHWLRRRGYDSSAEYLYEICRLILQETALYPHSNAGILTLEEMADLKEVNASMGLMLESTTEHLRSHGGAHEHAPSKDPQVRLQMIRDAGRLKIPFTTGLLIGIGENVGDRIDDLILLCELQREYGHIQEIIIQNFRAKPNTPMALAREPSARELMQAAALTRTLFGEEMNVQIPPNLSMINGQSTYLRFLRAGINDWGGISPLTIDHVNPEAPWPHLARLREQMQERGFVLRPRFPVYPEYIFNKGDYLPPTLLRRLEEEADEWGYIQENALFSLPAANERGNDA